MPKSKKKISATQHSVFPSSDETLERLRNHLMCMRQQLLRIDPDSLDDTLHEKWRKQVNSVSLAITKVRNAALSQINSAFAAELPALEANADKLAKALYKLKSANETISTIGDGIDLIKKTLTLLS